MIAHPPHQQIHAHHVAISLVILFLTVSPYLFTNHSRCCSVSAYSSEDFGLSHNNIAKFDIIETSDIILLKSISKRSTNQSGDFQNIVESHAIPDEHRIKFSFFGLQYVLILKQASNLISKDFTIVTLDKNGRSTTIPYDRTKLEIFEGFLENNSGSLVTASYSKENKLITAQIKSDKDTIIVEPTYLHRNSLNSNDTLSQKFLDETMIVYKLSDYDQMSSFRPDQLCNATSIDDTLNPTISKEKLKKRGIEFFYDQAQPSKSKTRCTLHLVADYLFYKHVGNGDLQTTINYLLALINRVNQIYLPTQWDAGDNTNLTNIGFTVQNITIHQEHTRLSSDEIHYNMESDKIWEAREFLDNFSRYSPPKHYCLAHLLTYRQFNSPVLGLAYVASTRFGTIGGICSPTQQRGDAYYRHNTGISTSKGINGETLITRQADLLLAHELGHNFGAEHDSNECRPAPALGGAYLMHPYSVMGFEKNNRVLSRCSRSAIGRVIRRKAPTCFIEAIDNICGNGVREDDEECDGGDIGYGHSDPCCDSSCRFTPGSQCSDRHSWCCSKCQIVPAGRPCRPAEEFNCKQASYCDGRSAECPRSPPVEDDKVCVGKGLCRAGECVPFCEARGLNSCLCNNAVDACRLCCKTSINSTCVPYDPKAPYLPDGVLCYRGVCEKGRCEQPIQDVVERLWDVIEDINLTTFVKFLKDNIILVVLLISIPLWCLISHVIDEFDKRIKQDVINTIMKHRQRRKQAPTNSPFLPRLFVGDDHGSTNSLNEFRDEPNRPLNQSFPGPKGERSQTQPHSFTNGKRSTIGFQPPNLGFKLPAGEEVVIEPRFSIAMNSIELPQQAMDDESGGEPNDNDFNPSYSYSTQV